MSSHTLSSRAKIKSKWCKVKRVSGLYQYIPSQIYHARVRHGGKLYRESLNTKDLPFAKRKLSEFKQRLERTDCKAGKITLVAWLDTYAGTLKGAPGAIKAKQRIIARIKETWIAARKPMRDLRRSEVETWLNEQYGDWSQSYYNSALSLIRSALDLAQADHLIMENPVALLTYEKRDEPIRITPTFEQFKAIVADIRAQTFNREAEESGDFVEFIGLAGLGQAEVAPIKRAHVRLDSGQIDIYRNKTRVAFTVPIFPQLRPLVERLCDNKKHDQRLFSVNQARKAITNACKRLELPIFTHRSLRRMFITRAIERGVDVKVLAEWQGHRDGGKLILQTYSHVRPIHSNRMAALMTDGEPDNVVRMKTGAA